MAQQELPTVDDVQRLLLFLGLPVILLCVVGFIVFTRWGRRQAEKSKRQHQETEDSNKPNSGT
ncbi:MAG: hypothetical protein HYR64_06940 [Fimbriimonas ginsengisoli]|uniref:Uncharacterized protein n=1 Tax=Fimbriimonas ginsengisoli TaxID=1005039 RepID=A0A931PW13_FIMGI|nr:hypothetical protein [Fimbriimonas ginsengisoli]